MPHEHYSEEWEGDALPAPRRHQPTWVTQFRRLLLRNWQPGPLATPTVDPDLENLSGVERSAEAVRYSFRSLEFWLSPGGFLREWLRFNARIAAFLGIPSVLVVPIITFALGQFKTWAALVAATTTNLILFPLSALVLIGLISGLFYIGRAILMMRRMRGSQPYHDRY
jgi:hypothetical protein